MAIGRGCYSSERDASGVHDRGAFDALFAPIYRISARLLASTRSLQRIALILTRARHACAIGRVDFSAEPSVFIVRYGSITLKSTVGDAAIDGHLRKL